MEKKTINMCYHRKKTDSMCYQEKKTDSMCYHGKKADSMCYHGKILSQFLSFIKYSMHLRGFSRWYFPQVMTCLSLRCSLYILYQIDILPQNISLKLCLKCKFSIWNASILGKMTNLSPKIIIYLLAWLLHSLFWNKLAKNGRICMLKNSVESFMSKSNFFLNKCTKTCWSHLNSPNIRQFFLSFRWNK